MQGFLNFQRNSVVMEAGTIGRIPTKHQKVELDYITDKRQLGEGYVSLTLGSFVGLQGRTDLFFDDHCKALFGEDYADRIEKIKILPVYGYQIVGDHQVRQIEHGVIAVFDVGRYPEIGRRLSRDNLRLYEIFVKFRMPDKKAEE